MSIKCLMNGLEVDYPCSPVCALFGDCVSAFSDYQRTKVRTNADRIRAMSDEELAETAYRFAHSNNKPLSVQDMLEWLKQPVKEDA